MARSGLIDLGNEALPYVNDSPVHLVGCLHAPDRKPGVRFIHLQHPGPVPGYETCSVGILLLCAATDPVVLTDFNKVLAGQARNPERFYIIGGSSAANL